MRATIASFVLRNYRVLFYKAQQRFQTPTGRATCDVKKKEELSINQQPMALSPSLPRPNRLKKKAETPLASLNQIARPPLFVRSVRFGANQSKVPLSHSTTHFLGMWYW
jgi:hypothetical protein